MPDRSTHLAIVGMSGRFPGASTITRYWENLRDGVESISFFTDDELLRAGIAPNVLSDPDYVKAGAILEGVTLFDAPFFRVPAAEARIMDPQQRLFLECAWEALEDAGYDPDHGSRRIGLFAGSGFNMYLVDNLWSNPELERTLGIFSLLINNDKDFLTTRTAYKLNLRGPSLNVQTACSTSLVAVHQACQSLLAGESDMALAGGVSVRVPQIAGYYYQQGGIGSPDGHCRAFDARAQGTVFGSGVGIVVLKRFEDALADGDTIRAVIRGSAVNNDGSAKVGYTAPSVDGQAAVIAEALAIAEIEPETVQYVEAHGTGTSLGDPIEVTALSRVFGSAQRQFCAIGSVKTNIGHLDTAAGVAGLIKTVLALQHEQLPPSLHFEHPNPEIDFANSPFYVNTTLRPWKAGRVPRRAGVSSFGIGGTNAHVVLEEAPQQNRRSSSPRHYVVTLSARTATGLQTAAANLSDHIEHHPEVCLGDIAYTVNVGRRAFPYRRAVIANSREELLHALRHKGVTTTTPAGTDSHVVFMFPGQGAQHLGMGHELYRREPVFRKHVDACATTLKPLLRTDLREILYPEGDAAPARLDRTEFTQPALFVTEYALAQLWLSRGLRPKALIGHSIGEYTAACLAGVLSLDDVLRLVAMRGQLMQALPEGGMLAVMLAEAELIPRLPTELSLAAVNAPQLCVVAGPPDAIVMFQKELEGEGTTCRRLRASHGFHSHMVQPMVEAYRQHVRSVSLKPPTIPYISNVTGEWITAREATDPEYWVSHLRQPVQFERGLFTLAQKPGLTLLEVGPGQTLTTLVQEQGPGFMAEAVPSLRHPRRDASDTECILHAAGRLWSRGAELDWPTFWTGADGHRIPLPTYPFERQHYWVDRAASDAAANGTGRGLSPMPEHSAVAGFLENQLQIIRQQMEVLRSGTRSDANRGTRRANS